MTIEGLDIVVSGGKAKLTARSYNKSNPSMYRAGTAQYKVAVMNKAKADRILNSLNSTGSYTNSHGMRTYMNGGQWRQEAVYRSEAWETQQMINARGGLKPQPIRSEIEEEIEKEEKEQEEKLQAAEEAVERIQERLEHKIQAYFDKVNEASSNIGQSIVDVLTY